MNVFIADDSILIRNIVKEILASDPSIKLVGEAANGSDAVSRILLLKPDIVIMDIDMPIMNGLDATKAITSKSDIAVMVFTHNNDPELPFKALELGAVDFLLKPDFADLNKPDYMGRFVTKLKVLSTRKPKPIRILAEQATELPSAIHRQEASETINNSSLDSWLDKMNGPITRHGPNDGNQNEFRAFHADIPAAELIVIGASTGGPQALCWLFRSMVAPFPMPIVLVQHIETGFDASYADWLASETGHEAHLAAPGLIPKPGVIYISPTDIHLRLSRNGFILDDGPKVLNQKPSVDILFESAAQLYGPTALGILLTGMGSDGAQGCASIRSMGGYTVVQDEESSLIFGMPKAAIERGAASVVLPLGKIAPFLAAVAEKRHE
ncbi:MAG TPA: chemotaxis-specific protein-glutamate methyltransferase CheB [Spirochaetales bacterium]|nr:chemotaxis-specific protein-glutamate methyltransferase CheB [Spirochaetales bacterium]